MTESTTNETNLHSSNVILQNLIFRGISARPILDSYCINHYSKHTATHQNAFPNLLFSFFLPMPPFSALMKMHENTLQGATSRNGQELTDVGRNFFKSQSTPITVFPGVLKVASE